jgi:hypothetical protein
LDALEAEITELCGHINAAEYRFLKLVAEFDRAEGWARHGLASCAQWLNWQCGLGAVAARERVRTARALERLPKLSAAFARGEISYSKVRALTRIATLKNEHVLLTIALHGTALHAERLARKYRRVQRAEEAANAQAQHRERYLNFFHDEDGAMVIHARLPAEVGALVRKAILAAVDAAEKTPQAPAAATDNETRSNVSAETNVPDDSKEPIAARRADGLALLAQQFLSARALGYGSAADRYQVVVHIDRAQLSNAPARDQAVTLAGALKPQTCEIEHGPRLAADTARRLACDGALVGIVEDVAGDPLDIGRRTRAIPPALRRALKSRDGGCRFPGCTHTRFTEGHHVEHWADGGETKLGNLITLCTFHHHLVHEGGFGLRATDDGVFVFTRPDGTRIADAGPPVPVDGTCFSGNISPSGVGSPPLFGLNRRCGIEIDAHTARSRWQGEPMDYGYASEIIYNADHPPRSPSGCP